MTRQEALTIIAQTERDYTQTQRIVRGLSILATYDDDIDCAFEHDQMYASDFEGTVEKMTEADVAELARLGWFEALDSWSHF